jgi:hypothetical protein
VATYKIIATSWVLWILTLLATVVVGALLLHELLPKDSTISLIAVIFLMALAVFIQRYISRAIVEIKLADNSISIKWLRQFLFHKRPDMEILFSDIESYKYQEDTHFDLFKLTLKDGKELKFWHFTLTRGDDFDKLVFDFPAKVSRYNSKVERRPLRYETSKNKGIEKEKTIFEGSSAPILAGFAILLLVAVPLILFISPTDKISNPFIGLASMSGGLFFLIQYFKHRKKNKTG